MNKWRLILSWPTLTLLQIDGSVTKTITLDNATLALLTLLQTGDTIEYEINA